MKQPLAAGSMQVGVAIYGRPHRRPVALAPKPTVCVCGTNTELSPCPANCPTRTDNLEPS